MSAPTDRFLPCRSIIHLFVAFVLGAVGLIGCGADSSGSEPASKGLALLEDANPPQKVDERCDCAQDSLGQNPFLPELDPETKSMRSQPPDLRPWAATGNTPYFEQAIPRNVHNIWFGDSHKMQPEKVNRWHAFARAFNYEHRLWTEGNLLELREIMPPDDYELLQNFLAHQSYHAASDLVRLHLLLHFGGVYADVDIGPPEFEDGRLVDLASIASMTNCILMTENVGRNVGNSGIFVMNGFMAAAPDHPLIKHFVDTVGENARHYAAERPSVVEALPYRGAPYQTGPFFINMALAGVMQVLPIKTGYQWHMVE